VAVTVRAKESAMAARVNSGGVIVAERFAAELVHFLGARGAVGVEVHRA